MLHPGIILAAVVVTFAAIAVFIRLARLTSSTAKNENSFGPVEAKRNTLRGELHDLGLGIRQVQGYIDALKGDETSVQELRVAAQEELDKASKLASEIEPVLDNATTEAQIDGFALGLEEARTHVRKARAKALSLKDDEDEDD